MSRMRNGHIGDLNALHASTTQLAELRVVRASIAPYQPEIGMLKSLGVTSIRRP